MSSRRRVSDCSSMATSVLVSASGCDSYFGDLDGTPYSVHVVPARNAPGHVESNVSWEVTVAEVGATAHAVVRSDREFLALHRELEAAAGKFSEPLARLHLRRSLLEVSAEREASNLQRWLASVVMHSEARHEAAFTSFISSAEEPLPIEFTESTLRREPTLVRAPSTTNNAALEAAPAKQVCKRVKLSWTDEGGDHEVELPVLTPTAASAAGAPMGHRVIDVRTLGAQAGFFTHDPGFTSTSSCVSSITFIDGDRGVLLHRGYAINDLAARCSFPEVAYLLVDGELPTGTELATFDAELKRHWMVHEKLIAFYQGFKSDAHPMAIMVGVVGALSAFYPDSCDVHDAAQRRLSAIRLIAKMPTIAAICYKTCTGEPVVYPSNTLPFAANFLRMMFATPCETYTVDPVHARALETIFILHADHEQNASTSTVRIASSSQTNPFACIAAGIASLWGPAHGGANEAVLRMLDEIGTAERIPLFLAKAKDKADPFRLMGFGHRVYKNHDPRATLMRGVCQEVLATLAKKSPQLELAQQLEAAALADEYFVKRKLYPNVDFYSGIVLSALGIPRDMFTVIFAVARCVGWLAQWNESFADAQQHRISRPRQLYVGAPPRDFVPREAR